MRLLAFGRTQSGHIFRACVEATESEIRPITVQPPNPMDLEGGENSLFNLTKAFYKPFGRSRYGWQPEGQHWDDRPQWVIAGYQNDDVGEVLDRLGLRPPMTTPPGEVE
jgi:hypothetical protein